VDGFRLELVAHLMQIYLGITKSQRLSSTAEGLRLHTQDLGIEPDGAVYIGDRQNEVVEASNMHGVLLTTGLSGSATDRSAARRSAEAFGLRVSDVDIARRWVSGVR